VLHAQAAVGILDPLKNLVLLSKLILVHNTEPDYHLALRSNPALEQEREDAVYSERQARLEAEPIHARRQGVPSSVAYLPLDTLAPGASETENPLHLDSKVGQISSSD
jgi:hypothetical protein